MRKQWLKGRAKSSAPEKDGKALLFWNHQSHSGTLFESSFDFLFSSFWLFVLSVLFVWIRLRIISILASRRSGLLFSGLRYRSLIFFWNFCVCRKLSWIFFFFSIFCTWMFLFCAKLWIMQKVCGLSKAVICICLCVFEIFFLFPFH